MLSKSDCLSSPYAKDEPGSVSDDDYYAAVLAVERYRTEATAAKAQVRVAAAELRGALVKLAMHEVRSPAAGRVRQLCKVRGEYASEGETVIEVEPEAPRR